MSPQRILIVEDEPALADSIRYVLEHEGFEATAVADGAKVIDLVRSWRPDLVLLDLMLPGRTGTEICRDIRKIGPLPIVIVTAKDSEADKVVGLELGADDYVTKPFSMREVVARVRAVLRRAAASHEEEHATSVHAGPVSLDSERHEVRIRGEIVELPPKEFALLEVLVRRAGRLMTREALINQVWGEDYYGDTRTLDVHVKRLRAKIEVDPKRPMHLRTIRGLGYRFEQ